MAKKATAAQKASRSEAEAGPDKPDLTAQEIVGIVPTPERISSLISQLGDGSLVPRPDFQRRLVWTDKHKRNFLETVLRKFPFPEIYIATVEVDQTTAKSTRILVDGQQRVTTLRAYFLGDESLKLGTEIPSFEDLSQEDRKAFLQYPVTVRDLGELRMQTVKEIYRRINSTNYALNNMENLYAQYDGKFRQFCEWVADHAFFTKDHDIFTESDKRRMFDLSFAITLVISMVQGYPDDSEPEKKGGQHYPHRNEEHENFLRKYNVTFPQEKLLRAQMEALFEKVEELGLPSNSRAWKQIDLLTLLVEMHHALFKDQPSLDLKTVGSRLNAFYKEADKFDADREADAPKTDRGAMVMNYLRAATRASTDRYSRVQRGQIIESILKGDVKKS